MCLEGGCGACVVTIKAKHPVDHKDRTWAAASVRQLNHNCFI